jgi:hypothetical protein
MRESAVNLSGHCHANRRWVQPVGHSAPRSSFARRTSLRPDRERSRAEYPGIGRMQKMTANTK